MGLHRRGTKTQATRRVWPITFGARARQLPCLLSFASQQAATRRADSVEPLASGSCNLTQQREGKKKRLAFAMRPRRWLNTRNEVKTRYDLIYRVFGMASFASEFIRKRKEKPRRGRSQARGENPDAPAMKPLKQPWAGEAVPLTVHLGQKRRTPAGRATQTR